MRESTFVLALLLSETQAFSCFCWTFLHVLPMCSFLGHHRWMPYPYLSLRNLYSGLSQKGEVVRLLSLRSFHDFGHFSLQAPCKSMLTIAPQFITSLISFKIWRSFNLVPDILLLLYHLNPKPFDFFHKKFYQDLLQNITDIR